MKRAIYFALPFLLATCVQPAWAQPAQPRTLMQLLIQQFNLLQPPECPETDTTVGTTAVRVGNNDPASVQVILTNTGSSNCFRSSLPTLTTSTGTLVAANGGVLEYDFRTDSVIPAQEQWLICSGAGNNIHMQRCDLR